MRATHIILIAGAAIAATGLVSGAQSQNAMTFFVTSAGPGKGADLGGLEGADRHCQTLAQAAGAGGKTWKAYLSTQGAGAVNAKDAGRVRDARRRRRARREARRPADLRGDHRHDVREVDAVVARSADPDQPVGERRALGEGDAAVPAHHRVPLAGRAHRARDATRRPKRKR